MQEFRCEYRDDGGEPVTVKGTLRSIQRVVGLRHVTLDGVPGHFQICDDEAATPQFVMDRGAKR